MCGDVDGVDVQRQRWRTARLAHACCACTETVRPGDLYSYTTVVFDGSAGQHKHCARCWTMFSAICELAEGPVLFTLDCGEDWADVFGEPPEDVAALAFMSPDDAQRLAAVEARAK